MNQKLLLTILSFYYVLYYTSRFDFWHCVSCILSASWRNFFLLSGRWMSLSRLPLLSASASPPSSGKKKIHGCWRPILTTLQPIWRFVVLNFLSETFRDCYNTCLDKIIGRYCNFFLYTVSMFLRFLSLFVYSALSSFEILSYPYFILSVESCSSNYISQRLII